MRDGRCSSGACDRPQFVDEDVDLNMRDDFKEIGPQTFWKYMTILCVVLWRQIKFYYFMKNVYVKYNYFSREVVDLILIFILTHLTSCD